MGNSWRIAEVSDLEYTLYQTAGFSIAVNRAYGNEQGCPIKILLTRYPQDVFSFLFRCKRKRHGEGVGGI